MAVGGNLVGDVLAKHFGRGLAHVVIGEHQLATRERQARHHLVSKRLVRRDHRCRERHRIGRRRDQNARIALLRGASRHTAVRIHRDVAAGESALRPCDVDPAVAVDRHRGIRVRAEAER